MFRVSIVCAVLALASGEPSKDKSHPPLVGINPFTPQGRIVGGRETSIEEHPWQVSLQLYGTHLCGGSIISKDTILTAGHCATIYPAERMSVRLGSSKTSDGGTLHEISKIVVHALYKINMYGIPENDVAVLKLKVPIEFGKTAQPVRLYNQGEEAIEGLLYTISGWGTLTEEGLAPEVLQTVDIPVITKSECTKAYESLGGVPAGQICTAYPAGGKDACHGDSGGPLTIAGRQAGIVSWGNGCARKGHPGVHTEIALYREWLAEHAGV